MIYEGGDGIDQKQRKEVAVAWAIHVTYGKGNDPNENFKDIMRYFLDKKDAEACTEITIESLKRAGILANE